MLLLPPAEWIETLVGMDVGMGPSFYKNLENGVVLCSIINSIRCAPPRYRHGVVWADRLQAQADH